MLTFFFINSIGQHIFFCNIIVSVNFGISKQSRSYFPLLFIITCLLYCVSKNDTLLHAITLTPIFQFLAEILFSKQALNSDLFYHLTQLILMQYLAKHQNAKLHLIILVLSYCFGRVKPLTICSHMSCKSTALVMLN